MTALDVNEGLSPEQIRLREHTHRFAAEVLRPAALELDDLPPDQVISPDSRLWDVFREAYSAGYDLRSFPPELRGPGLTPEDAWVAS